MLFVQPGEIVVIQRGQKFKVNLPDGPSRGYILEVWGANFELPELGPLGANGLANARDFLHPVARYEIEQESWAVTYKLGGKYFKSTQQHSPFDVVAWHGNYVPYKYDLTKFVNVDSISVDHIDPSIFCVLTARSRDPAAPLANFLIFLPRWDVALHTYRLPYFYYNVALEFIGLLYSKYSGYLDKF
jgi:homogentisate 1,2-dioxygenase